jgi:predicted Zn finger-like uncharacterized protein
MRIACPNCAAEYEVPDEKLAGGPRLLKCARCGHSFQAALPPPPPPSQQQAREAPRAPRREPTQPPPPAPESRTPRPAPDQREPPPDVETDRPRPTRGPTRHSPIDEPAGFAEKQAAPSGASIALAWLLSLAALGLAAWAAVHYRAEVMETFPAATRLYRALGLG